jgi:hypothetical protein
MNHIALGRLIAALGLFATLAACGGGGWLVARPAMALFVVSGARDTVISSKAYGDWRITYTTPDVPATWYTTVSHRLEERGWRSPDNAAYGPLIRTYSHTSSLVVCELHEWVSLRLDPFQPHVAHIWVRRWIAFPWLTPYDY